VTPACNPRPRAYRNSCRTRLKSYRPFRCAERPVETVLAVSPPIRLRRSLSVNRSYKTYKTYPAELLLPVTLAASAGRVG
jgi:hypothetical protein